MPQMKYEIDGVPLNGIRNRNEERVIRLLPQVLVENADYRPDYLDIQDIYALTLNSLPPRYKQSGSIVLRELVGEKDILKALREAVERVRRTPTAPHV